MFTGLAIDLLYKSVNDVARREGRFQFAEYGRPVKLAAISSFAMPLVAGNAIVLKGEESYGNFLMAAVFLLLSIYLCLKTFIYRIKFDDVEIIVSSPWGGKIKIPLGAVSDITYSKFSMYYTLHARGFGKIKVSPLLSGRASLLVPIHKRLSGER